MATRLAVKATMTTPGHRNIADSVTIQSSCSATTKERIVEGKLPGSKWSQPLHREQAGVMKCAGVPEDSAACAGLSAGSYAETA